MFTLIGFVTVAAIVIALLGYRWYTRDAFNYADESAPELNVDKATWQSFEWSQDLNIDVRRAAAVIYWQDGQVVRTNCKSRDAIKIVDSTLRLNRARCLLILPKVATTLKADQAKVVLVRPQVSLDINITQSELKVAANNQPIQYIIDGKRAHIAELASAEDADIRLTIESEEAELSRYSY